MARKSVNNSLFGFVASAISDSFQAVFPTKNKTKTNVKNLETLDKVVEPIVEKVNDTWKVGDPIPKPDWKNGESVKLYNRHLKKQRRAENPEKYRRQNKQWRAENPEYQKRWRAENPEKAREQARKWRAENPEKAREQDRQKRAKNPEKYKAKARQRRAENPEKYRGLDKQWYDKNTEKRSEKNKKVRSKLKETFLNKYKKNGRIECANKYCRETDPTKLTLDHKNSEDGKADRAAGMSGATIMRKAIKTFQPKKIQILCWCCNSRKGDRTWQEFMKREKERTEDTHEGAKLQNKQERRAESRKTYNANLKEEAFSFIAGKNKIMCAISGEKNIKNLSIDHVDPASKKVDEEILGVGNARGPTLYRLIRKMHREGTLVEGRYQILRRDLNSSKGTKTPEEWEKHLERIEQHKKA